jgi:cell division topological specificity factor
MADWLAWLASKKTNKSASAAKDRLKLVLINDRTDLTPAELESMKNELLMVISRYIEIDSNAVRIDMTQEGRQQRLLADIPIRAATRKTR